MQIRLGSLGLVVVALLVFVGFALPTEVRATKTRESRRARPSAT